MVRDASKEGKACDAVARLLERRLGLKRSKVRLPELEHCGPPVDYEFWLGDQVYALEHTELETFSNQIRSTEQFLQLTLPIIDQLSGKLPKPGAYRVYFPTEARVEKGRDRLEQARQSIIQWIETHALMLHGKFPRRLPRDHAPSGYMETIEGTPDGVQFSISLTREVHWKLSERFDGQLSLARYAPRDYKIQRLQRMHTALDRKCPKLQQCKAEGARTILILEDSDISLSNHWTVSEAFAEAAQGRTDLPDEVYLVSTVVSEWSVWSMKVGPSIGLSEERWEFHDTDLDDVASGGGL